MKHPFLLDLIFRFSVESGEVQASVQVTWTTSYHRSHDPVLNSLQEGFREQLSAGSDQ